MHTYTKKYIDELIKNCLLKKSEVNLIKLTLEDIENLKLSLIKKKDIIPKEEVIDNTSIDDKPAEKKRKLNINETDVLQLVLPREGETPILKSQFNPSLKYIKEIASSSTEEVTVRTSIPVSLSVPTVIDCNESTKFANHSAKTVMPLLRTIDLKKMMYADKYKKWMKLVFLDSKTKHKTNDQTNLADAKPSTSKPYPLHTTKVKGVKTALNDKNHVRGNLTEIEKLYKKYFGKSVQDAVMIIANILYVITKANKYLKEQMDESFKDRSSAEILKKRCIATQLHEMHTKILGTKLKTNFANVISSLAESELNSAFHMVFLSILIELRVIDQPNEKKISTFKNVALLLSACLKNTKFKHPQMFRIFNSRTFRNDCIELIGLIEDSRDTDPEVIFRMPLFFMSTVRRLGYFQAAIDVVTGKSNENLASLIDSICSNIIQNTSLAGNPNGTYQLIPVLNGYKPQTNAGVKPSIETNQPLNKQPFSSSLQKKTSESSTSTVAPTNKCTVVTSAISINPLYYHQSTSSSKTSTLTQTKQPIMMVKVNPSIQNIKTEPNSPTPINIIKGCNIVILNNPLKLVTLPPDQKNADLLGEPKSTYVVKCYVNTCKNPASLLCSGCKIVKYCSVKCQRLHWYANHAAHCVKLKKQPTLYTVNFPLPK